MRQFFIWMWFAVLAISCVFAPLGACSTDETGAAFVWPASVPTGHEAYAVLRKVFDLPGAPESARLDLFADSRYILWINGQYVQRGPCRFDPKAPEYDTLDVAAYLRPGPNAVAVLVHHYHDGLAQDAPEALNGRTMRHAPGLTARLVLTSEGGATTTVTTDNTWRCCATTRFQPSGISWGCIPDNIDARRDTGDWTRAEFDDAAWEPAAPVDGSLWGALNPRSIPLLRETPVAPAAIMRQTGVEQAEPRPLASALPLTLAAEQEVVFDVGRAVLAYEVLDFDASDGAELALSHGSGYVNGNLDEVYGGDRYVARAGRQVYMSGDVWGFRYLLVRVVSGSVTVHGLEVVNRVYPFERLGRFQCSDAALSELWERGVRTVQLCSEDGYVDCTQRERAEWMGDAAVCEYPATRVAFSGTKADGTPYFSDPRLIRNMLRHIAQSQQPDGRLKAHHPSDRWDIHGYIEDYACLWVQTLRSYWENTGDAALVRELWPALVKQMQWFLDHRTERGLVNAREFVFFDNPLSYKVCEGTTLNAYVAGALRDAAVLAGLLGEADAVKGYAQDAADVAAAVNLNLWDEAAGTYHGGILDGQQTEPTAHAAMLALYYGIVPEARRASVFDWLAAHDGQVGTPYAHHFLLRVLYDANTPEMDRHAAAIMRDRWASTLARKDLDTVFEGFGGGALCHNIGAVPVYFLSAYVLGVRRDGPVVDRRLIVEPRPGSLESAEGAVVTELGVVPVAWRRGEGTFSLRLTVPDGATAGVRVPGGDPQAVTIDGRPAAERAGVRFLRNEQGRLVYKVEAGTYAFEVRE